MSPRAEPPPDATPSSHAAAIAIDPALPCEPMRILTPDEAEAIRSSRQRIAELVLLAPSDIPSLADMAERDAGVETVPREAGASLDLASETLDHAHDHYFRMRRSATTGTHVFARSLRSARDILAREFGGDAESDGHDIIAAALDAVLGLAADGAARDDLPAPAREDRGEAFGRWIRGHQVFAALTQGLIHVFLRLECATGTEEAEAALATITMLLDASAASLRLTGAFDPDIYQRLVRPSMAPPHVPRGFSGLLSADHRHLVQLMVRLRPLLGACAQRHPEAHAAMYAALAGVYDSHKFVCARFAGESTPSLRMKAQSTRSGVEQIETFKRARLRSLTIASEAAAS